MQLVVAEKPSVARDLARVLGARGKGRSCLEGDGRVITWCIGHLVELDEPSSYDARWKAWRLDTLPMIPARFKLRAVASTRDQLKAVKDLLTDRRFTEVVNACDAGREGELIFRYVYDLAGSKLPIRRLWISSMTDEAIKAGFAALKPGSQYEPLADAARCRSEADWLVGLNATRAVTVRNRRGDNSTLYSIGRVQTPTLAILVEREKAIRSFIPRDYWEVRGTFVTPGGDTLPAAWTRGKTTRLGKTELAQAVIDRDTPGPAIVDRVEQKKSREPPPLLFDLTSLQRTSNKRFGLSAQRTLEIAQALYESHKVLTYPRTDSRHLSGDLAGELPKIFRALGQVPDYAAFVDRPVVKTKRIFDDSKVQDHHAIIPTGKPVRLDALDRDERRVFDLVVRRFLGAFYPDAEFASTEVVIRVGAGELSTGRDERDAILDALPPPPDRYVARGRVRLEAGWQAVSGFGDGEEPEPTLPLVREGEALTGSYAPQSRQTKPPPRHTEATLLAAMETAGRQIDDDELRQAMKDTGLGTPATRASTIETILKRKFVERQGKTLVPTPLGIGLIDHIPVASLASAELTGRWEARLSSIARGKETRAAFMQDIARYVREVIDAVRGIPGRPAPAPAVAVAVDNGLDLTCPRCNEGRLLTGKRGWGCSRWREGCPFIIWFETAGRKLTEAQLKELVAKGKTRKAKWGRLVLDAQATGGAARVEAV